MNIVEGNSFNVEAEELQFQLPEGVLVAGKSWGDDSATINVVAVHGYLDSAATFDRLAPSLVAKSKGVIRVVAFDLSGMGKSSHRSDHTTYSNNWVTELVTVADAMGWNTFSVLAHSMGTGVAILTAGALPNRVERMVLLDAIGPSSIKPKEAPIRLEKALAQRLRVLQKKPRIYPTVESLLERMLKSDSQLTEGSARLLVGRSAMRVANGIQFSHDPKLRGTSTSIPLTEPEVIEFIKRISCPVLLIWAAHRWYPLNKDKNTNREKNFSNLTIENVEGNHHVHLEHPERVDPLILPFLLSPKPLTGKL